MTTTPRRNGTTRVEAVTCLACALALTVLGAVALAQQDPPRPMHNSETVKDATQLALLHKAFIIYSGDNDGILPVPGLINRLAVGDDAGPQLAGKQIPGMGAEDESINTSANLYSALIAQQYFTPELVVSPIERNPNVKAIAEYDFDQYNPAEDRYWDTSFAADLAEGSHASYAHQPVTKARRDMWKNSMDRELAQLGNRGPKDGRSDPRSWTCGPHGDWAGTVVFGDNHYEYFNVTNPRSLKGDNLFAADERREHVDALLAFTKQVKDGKAELQFD